MQKIKNFLVKEESGQGMVEYGLIIVLVAIAVIVALGLLGDEIAVVFGDIVTALQGA